MHPRDMKQPNSEPAQDAKHSDDMAPPAFPGQVQPWMKWYRPDELNVDMKGLDDNKPQQCSKLTQAVTAVWFSQWVATHRAEYQGMYPIWNTSHKLSSDSSY